MAIRALNLVRDKVGPEPVRDVFPSASALFAAT